MRCRTADRPATDADCNCSKGRESSSRAASAPNPRRASHASHRAATRTMVVQILCAGIVHGDLTDFNVLIAPDGAVIIDLSQAVDPAHNRNAQRLLLRDVRNLTSFLGRFAPSLRKTRYAEEMWALYEANRLTPETRLTGRLRSKKEKADTWSLLQEIEAVEREARARREALGLPHPRRRAQPGEAGKPPRRRPPPESPSAPGRSAAGTSPPLSLDDLLIVEG